jgi:hypothetical protein
VSKIVRHWYFLNPEGTRVYVLPEKGNLRASARLQRAGWERVSRKWLMYAMAQPAFTTLMSAPDEGEYAWTGERVPAT